MNNPEQVEALTADLERVIDRYRAEFELPLASYIGSLEVIKFSLLNEEFNPEGP